MKYIYGKFTNKQIKEAALAMHTDIHRLLLHKDNHVDQKIFENDDDFLTFFQKVLYKFGGTKTLFNNNGIMVALMSTLQAAYDESVSDHFDYTTFRKAILDSHGCIKQMFENQGGVSSAKSVNSKACCYRQNK